MRKSLFLIFLLLFTTRAFCWWDLPHMVIAKIAYDRLEPSTKAEADRLIQVFSKQFPNADDFVTFSCLPDDLSRSGVKAFSSWHFSDIPYNPEGILSESESKEILRSHEGKDLLFAIHQALYTLKHPDSSDWGKAFMLAFLIHCVGDAHQPLHAASLFSHRFPQGDRGGNFFPIRWEGEQKPNLHLFWDSGCLLAARSVARPLTEEGREVIEELVHHVTALTTHGEEDLDPCNWRAESFNLAVEYVYKGIQPGEAPSSHYIEKGQQVCGSQMALAGYRLARLLNKTLKASPSLSLP